MPDAGRMKVGCVKRTPKISIKRKDVKRKDVKRKELITHYGFRFKNRILHRVLQRAVRELFSELQKQVLITFERR
jgi:hypothetical protein